MSIQSESAGVYLSNRIVFGEYITGFKLNKIVQQSEQRVLPILRWCVSMERDVFIQQDGNAIRDIVFAE